MMRRRITEEMTITMMMILIIIPLYPSGPKQTKIIYPNHKLSALTARPRCLLPIYKYRFQTNFEVVN